jgi:DNA-binding SARP family transcriptional activator
VEFRILGPLEVLEDGRQLDLGGAKQRALLAMLLLHANEVLSQDRLIEAVWEEQPPETAPKALQVYISRLRKTLGKERLETKARGYLLRVAEGELDLERFQRLADERPKEALGLWRGEPLAEFAYQRFAQTEIARLEELRLACLERRLEEDLEQGRHATVVGELERLVREHPLRERLRAQLILALYRSGRQAEALEAYQDARRALTEELGIEPSQQLRELQQAILEQRPALELEPTDEQATQPNVVPFPKRSEGTEGRDARLERKTVSVVHVQVAVTSAGGGEVDPEVLRHVLGRVSEHVTVVIESHEGSIDVITGDSIGAVFGLPSVHEDDSSRALRAAEEIRDRLASLAEELSHGSTGRLEQRIGVSTGAVMTGGQAGSQLRATGAPLTTAARLAQEAEPGTIVADDATRRAAGARRDARRFVSPMVGRARERRRMHDAFDQAVADRSAQLFTILGAAGVGKSRLVQEFLGDLDGRALIARGRCLPYGDGITFWPILEAIKSLPAFEEGGGQDEALASLAALIDGTEDAAVVAQRVAEIIGVTEGAAGTEEGFEAVRMFLEALAAQQPLVVVLDDVHWGESTFLDLVEHLADWSRGVPILLLCMARPELLEVRPSWGGGKLNATSVLLEPLSDDECTELVANLVGDTELVGAVETRIANAAEGNPLFVEEMLSMLIDEGILVRDRGRWVAVGDLTAFPVPPSIHALLAARLDQLGEDERAAIEPAAVEGKVFHESSVAYLAPNVAAGSALGALVRKELIRPERSLFAGERAFRFRHLMIRDAAYDAIPKETRGRLHERHVEWLETKTGDRGLEFEEILGYHLEQAFQYRVEVGLLDEPTHLLGRQAAERLGAAGKRAFVRQDAHAAVALLSRAVALLPPDDPSRVELIPNVRVVQGLSWDVSWADRVLTEAVEAAAVGGDRRLAAHALVQRGFLRLFTKPDVTPEELKEVARRAISAFEVFRDDLGLARAWRLMAQAHYLERQAGRSVDASERALEHARRSGDPLERREVIEWLCVALMLGPAPASKAAERCTQLLEDVRREDPILEPTVISVLGNLEAMLGRIDEWERSFARFREVVNEVGETTWLFGVNFGFVALADDPVAAERELRSGYDVLRKFGEKSHFSSVTALLARTLYAQDRYDEAYQLTCESEEAARPNDIHSQILWRATRAKVLARRGELEVAESLAREAVAFAEASDFLDSHGDTLLDLAEVLWIAKRPEEATVAVETAIQLYETKENVVSADRAKALLKANRPARGLAEAT